MTKISKLSEQLGEKLKAQGLYLAVAESCTGGGLAYAITAIAGSSAWFDRGFVTYSNESKRFLLNVSQRTLDENGAVSVETAQEMVEGVLVNSPVDIAISITGIAGPDGGAKEKPVGTVCFALAQKEKIIKTIQKHFSGNRQSIREQAIAFALEWALAKVR